MLPAAAISPETKPQKSPRRWFVPVRTFFDRAAKMTDGTRANVKSICVIQPESSRLGPFESTPQMPQHVAAVRV